MILSIRSIALITLCLLVICPWSGLALSVKGGSGGSAGEVSFNIVTNLEKSANFKSTVSFDELTLDKVTEASGSGKNNIKESVSNGKDSISQVVLSSGNLDMQSSTIASGNSVASSQKANLEGNNGYIANSLDSSSNDVDLSAGFSGKGGSLKTDIQSVAAGSAEVAGSANIMGDEYLNSEATETINSISGTVLKSVDGLYLTQDDAIGSFGLNILKDDQKGRTGATADQDLSLYGTLYRWPNDPQIKLLLNTKGLPKGITSLDASETINDAANTWDKATSQNLFNGDETSDDNVVVSTTTTYKPNFNRVDYKNVHAFSRYTDPNVIAVTNTWYYGTGEYAAYNGDSLGRAVDSDCIYNTAFKWAINPSNTAFELGDIALHELGHTVGLRDFYDPSPSSWVMYGYRGLADNQRTELTPDDTTMLQYLYGA